MPFLLIAAESGIGAVLWLKESQENACKETSGPLKLNVACSIILDGLAGAAVVSDNRKISQQLHSQRGCALLRRVCVCVRVSHSQCSKLVRIATTHS